METFLYVTYIWFTFFLISYVFHPLFKFFLKNLVDSGWLAVKVLGLLIITFSSYLIGIFHIAKFSQLELWILLSVWFVIGRLFSKFSSKVESERWDWLKKVGVTEILFFCLLLFMAFIRGYQPNINGLEKFMDFGFIQSALTGNYFPPRDPWWAGSLINYYYFGHLWVANLIKLTGVPSGVGFNLALAVCFALSGSLIIEFTWTWTKRLWAGLLGAFMHLGLGNLHLVTTATAKLDWSHPFSSWKTFWDSFWYPDSSRLIYHVITEFPVYSYVVYDLHAHVLAFPQDLLVIGLIGEVFRNKKFGLWEGIVIGFLLGLNFLTNAWDLAVYYLLFGLVLSLFISFWVRRFKEFKPVLIGSAASFAASILVIWPFWHFFDRLSLPVLPTSSHSPLYQLFQLWGFWFFLGLSFAVFIAFAFKKAASKVEDFDFFILLLFGVGFLLVIIPEFIYVKDIYGVDYERANTVFKLTFQSWNIWAMGGGYVVWRLLTNNSGGVKKLLKRSWALVLVFLILSCFLYTVRAYKSGYSDFKIYSGLDGEKFISTTYSKAEEQSIDWVKKNTPPDSVVLEAAGDSYTNYNRVSVFTGRSTVIGWAVHEWLWRGSFDPVGKRQTDVMSIYTTNDPQVFKSLTAKYKISYIYIGNLERQKYLAIPGTGLVSHTTSVYKNEEVEVYKVNPF